jgi:hypothetical protein
MALSLNPGASDETLKAAERALQVELPSDYNEFLRASNGGEGFLGQNYIALWRVEELKERNDGYGVEQFAPGLILFGSDGGGEAYAFDTRANPWVVVQVPFIGMGDPSLTIALGRSFSEFLQNAEQLDFVSLLPTSSG